MPSTITSTIAETPIPQRTQKRGIPLRQDDIELEPKKKKVRNQEGDAFDIIVGLMKDQQAGHRNKVELAIQLLQDQYQERLSTSDFIDAVGILENSAKASIFITLQSSKI
jgi:hypothetical protein